MSKNFKIKIKKNGEIIANVNGNIPELSKSIAEVMIQNEVVMKIIKISAHLYEQYEELKDEENSQ